MGNEGEVVHQRKVKMWGWWSWKANSEPTSSCFVIVLKLISGRFFCSRTNTFVFRIVKLYSNFHSSFIVVTSSFVSPFLLSKRLENILLNISPWYYHHQPVQREIRLGHPPVDDLPMINLTSVLKNRFQRSTQCRFSITCYGLIYSNRFSLFSKHTANKSGVYIWPRFHISLLFALFFVG